MAHDVATSIVKLAKEIEDRENMTKLVFVFTPTPNAPVRETSSFVKYHLVKTSKMIRWEEVTGDKKRVYKLASCLKESDWKDMMSIIWKDILRNKLNEMHKRDPEHVREIGVAFCLRDDKNIPHLSTSARISVHEMIIMNRWSPLADLLKTVHLACHPHFSIRP